MSVVNVDTCTMQINTLSDGRTGLHYAAMSGNSLVIKVLIEFGADTNAKVNPTNVNVLCTL